MKGGRWLCLLVLLGCSCGLRGGRWSSLWQRDSVRTGQWRSQQTVLRLETLSSALQQQQWLEVEADGPYRWRPDSGLVASAGHLELKLWQKGAAEATVRRQAAWQADSQERSQLTLHQDTQEKAKKEKPVLLWLGLWGIAAVLLFFVGRCCWKWLRWRI